MNTCQVDDGDAEFVRLFSPCGNVDGGFANTARGLPFIPKFVGDDKTRVTR